MITPTSSQAIQLRWSSGTIDLSFTAATRCTLIAQADSAEQHLPAEWRLLWLANCQIRPTTEATPEEGPVEVCDTCYPVTRSDIAANIVTVGFCSATAGAAQAAEYVFDLPAGRRGKLKVVCLNSADSATVVESNEVTYSGGVSGTYAPVILLAGRTHTSSKLRVQAVGVGLADASTAEIAAPDTSWRLALNITERTATTLTATAQVAADLQPFMLQIGGTSMGAVAVAPLAADTASALPVQPACVDQMKEINLISHEDVQPKDFFMATSRDSFHISYTRQDMNLNSNPAADTKIIGHKRSRNLNDWFPTEGTMTAIAARPGRFNNGHVWAPTIVRKPNDPTYYLLYTGVDSLGIQRIGMATSFDLNVWTQDATKVYQSADVAWALPGTAQFRDPFVMANPDSAGRFVMYFVTVTQDRGRYVVGVTFSSDLRAWHDPRPLWNTDFVHSGASIVESPHAFLDHGSRWWLLYTGYNSGATQDSAVVSFETDSVSPTDPDTTRWSAPPDTLYKFLGGDQTLQSWHASEYLSWAPGYEYPMAFSDNQHSIDICAPNLPIYALATLGHTVFVGGDFSNIGGQPRTGLAAVDDSAGSATEWNPHADEVAWSLYVSGSTLYVGGKFGSVGGLPAARLAAISFPDPAAAPPQPFALAQSAPNPARATAIIHYALPTAMSVTLGVYDVQGRRVAKLLDHLMQTAGVHDVLVHADLWKPGVYFYLLEAAGKSATRKMLVVR